MTDLIRRADAIEAVLTYFIPRSHTGERGEHEEDFVRTIFKALPSAEAPKGDLISRQWLLEVYGDYIGDNGESKYNVPLEVVRQNIKDAPSAEAVPSEQYKKGFEDAKRAFELEFAREAESIRKGWIPVSERLPEEDGWYLVTVQGYETVTDVSLYSADGCEWGDVSTKQKVIAWMPLPKPYREESEVEE